MDNPRHRSHSPTSSTRLAAVERQGKALALRKGGASYTAIAKALGYRSIQAAYYSVEAALQRILREPGEEVRKLELERLDSMWLSLWDRIRRGDIDAIDAGLRIIDRRAKLLGLYPKEPALIVPISIDGRQQNISVNAPLEMAKLFMAKLAEEGYILPEGLNGSNTAALSDGDPGSDGLRE